MARKFLTPIDLTDNELLNVIFQNVGTLPGTVINGKPLYNTATDQFLVGIGGVWTDLADRGIVTITGDGGAVTIDATDPANPVINVADANTTTSGFMSASHFDLLQAATANGDVNSLVLRDASGAAAFDSVTINGTPTDPTDAATKAYVDNIAAAGMKIVGTLDASTNPNYPSAAIGEAYHISVAGKVGGASGLDVEVGDMVVAVAASAGGDQAAAGADFIIMQTNIDQATTTVRGAIRIATLAEVAAGTSTDTAVTPAGLKQEIDALGNSETQSALVGDGTALTHAVNHTLSSQWINVQTFDAASGEICDVDITLTDATTVTVGTSTPLANNALRIVLTGTK